MANCDNPPIINYDRPPIIKDEWSGVFVISDWNWNHASKVLHLLNPKEDATDRKCDFPTF